MQTLSAAAFGTVHRCTGRAVRHTLKGPGCRGRVGRTCCRCGPQECCDAGGIKVPLGCCSALKDLAPQPAPNTAQHSARCKEEQHGQHSRGHSRLRPCFCPQLHAQGTPEPLLHAQQLQCWKCTQPPCSPRSCTTAACLEATQLPRLHRAPTPTTPAATQSTPAEPTCGRRVPAGRPAPLPRLQCPLRRHPPSTPQHPPLPALLTGRPARSPGMLLPLLLQSWRCCRRTSACGEMGGRQSVQQ